MIRAITRDTEVVFIVSATLHVDWENNYPIARLFADRYAEIGSIRRHSIPTPDQTQHNED